MRISKFKGLYTNTDPNDIKLEYLATARNLRLRNKVTETKFFDSETIDIPSGIIKVLAYEPIELDNDKLQSIIADDKIVPTYLYHIENKYLLIGNTATETKFYLDNVPIANPLNKKFDSAVIYKDQGNILILCGTETLWLGKINRNVWINGTIKNINQWYLDRYLEPYDINNMGVNYFQGNTVTDVTLKANRRLGFHISVFPVVDQLESLEEVAVNFSLIENFKYTEGSKYYPEDFPPLTGYASSHDMHMNLYRCRVSVAVGKYKVNDIIYSLDEIPKEYHAFAEPRTGTYISGSKPDTTLIGIPKFYFYTNEEEPQNFIWKGALPINWPVGNREEQFPFEQENVFNNDFLMVPKTDLTTAGNFVYQGEKIGDFGFEASLKKSELVVTSILDYKEELITEYIKIDVGTISVPKYGLEINTTIPSNVNSRLTGICYYLRFVDTNDFVQVKSFNLVSADKENANYMKFIVGEISENGIELVQTIGTLFNPDNFELVHAFDQFQRVDGLPYMVSKNQVYGGVTGNGKVLDLFYSSNRIPNVTNKPIVYISDLNGIPAIHDTEKTTLLLAVPNNLGGISYSKRDIVGFAIKNQYDIAVSPDGIAIHTKEGIFIYNGSQLTPISEEINDIIESNHSTGKIFFNNISKDLYYIVDSEFDEFYRYSFVDRTWTSHLLPEKISVLSLQNVAIDTDGNLLLVASNQIFKLINSLKGTAILITQLSDLGRPKEFKALMEYRIDFEGTIQFNGKDYTNAVRNNTIIPIPVHLRTPDIKMSIAITMIDNAKIYGIDVDEETIAMVDN